jgi:hypothetical protein
MIIVLVPKPINPKPAIMKNLLFLCICFCLVATTKAQFEKGQKVIAGQFSFYTQSTQINSPSWGGSHASDVFAAFSYSSFSSPTILKGFGINLVYGDNSTNSIGNSVGVFYNYTKLEKLANRFYLTFDGTAAINYSQGNFNPTKQTFIFSNVSLNLGLLYHLNNRFLLSASLVNLARLSYSFSETNTSMVGGTAVNTKRKGFNFNSGLSGFNLNNVAFGFRYLLKKK